MDGKRKEVTYVEEIEPWLTQVEEKMKALNPDPSLVINIDETPVYYVPTTAAVFVPENSRTMPIMTTPARQKAYTVTLAISLSGKAYPSQLIIPASTIPHEFQSQSSPLLVLNCTQNGYQTKQTFAAYIRDTIIPAIQAERLNLPTEKQNAIIFLDQHSSRMDADLLALCKAERIEIISIIPHASHIIQPLDRGVNAVLKRKFSMNFDMITTKFVVYSSLFHFQS